MSYHEFIRNVTKHTSRTPTTELTHDTYPRLLLAGTRRLRPDLAPRLETMLNATPPATTAQLHEFLETKWTPTPNRAVLHPSMLKPPEN